jgi:hypothetical protein
VINKHEFCWRLDREYVLFYFFIKDTLFSSKVINKNKTAESNTGGDTTIVTFIKSEYPISFLQRWDGFTKEHLE